MKFYDFTQKNCTILSAENQRAVDTACILSNQIKATYRQDLSKAVNTFIISDWSPLKLIQLEKFPIMDLTEIYFQLYKSNTLPRGFPTPPQIAKNFISFVDNLNIQTKNIILVGNGGSLEASSYYQNKFILVNNTKKILDYSQYIELAKN